MCGNAGGVLVDYSIFFFFFQSSLLSNVPTNAPSYHATVCHSCALRSHAQHPPGVRPCGCVGREERGRLAAAAVAPGAPGRCVIIMGGESWRGARARFHPNQPPPTRTQEISPCMLRGMSVQREEAERPVRGVSLRPFTSVALALSTRPSRLTLSFKPFPSNLFFPRRGSLSPSHSLFSLHWHRLRRRGPPCPRPRHRPARLRGRDRRVQKGPEDH